MVGFAHLLLGVPFGVALELAHFKHLIFQSHLVVESFVELYPGCNAVPVEHSLGVEVEFVGYRSQIIGSLRVGIAVCDNPLAAFFEVGQRVAQFL